MRKNIFLALLVFSSAAIAQVAVQSDPNPDLDAAVQGKKDALDAFKNGNSAAALSKVKDNVSKKADSPKEDIQVNAQLLEISYWLANEQHPRTKEVTLVAIDQHNKSRAKLNKSEEATALAAMGLMYEQILGDQVNARASYTAALALDGKEPDATKGLARLNNYAAQVAAKARENEAIRQRALNPIR